MADLILENGLPANLDAERAVLGSLLLDHPSHADALTLISPDDFSIEKHRRIFAEMVEIDRAGGRVDRVTLAKRTNEPKATGVRRWNFLSDGS